MNIALLILGGIFIVATLLPLIRHDHWAIRDFDFPHVQITSINILILLVFLFTVPVVGWLNIAFVILMVGCIVYQCYIIYPYTYIAPAPVKKSQQKVGDNSFDLMVTNVLMTNRNAQGCLDIVKDVNPDMILMVETDQWWCEQMQHLREKYQYAIEYPLENTYGMLFYSKLPIAKYDIKFLVNAEIPSFHINIELRSGKKVNLYCVHPEPPSPTESETSTERDAELLILGKNIIDADEPTLVAGDLNDVAWSYTTRLFIKISQLLDPRMGRGFFNTFHAGYRLLRWPLDHVFLSPHFRLLDIKRLPYYGSDHFPMYVAVNYEPRISNAEMQESADEEEQELAEEKIDAIHKED